MLPLPILRDKARVPHDTVFQVKQTGKELSHLDDGKQVNQ